MKWIDCAERLPKEGEIFWGFVKDRYETVPYCAKNAEGDDIQDNHIRLFVMEYGHRAIVMNVGYGAYDWDSDRKSMQEIYGNHGEIVAWLPLNEMQLPTRKDVQLFTTRQTPECYDCETKKCRIWHQVNGKCFCTECYEKRCKDKQ